MKILFFILFGVFALPIPVVAANYTAIYPKDVLAADAIRYSMVVHAMYDATKPYLTSTEREILDRVGFQFPHPQLEEYFLNFFSDGMSLQVFLPILSIKMIEDLSTAYAWLQVHGYSLDTIDVYVAMLSYKPESAFFEGHYPPPLKALGIPANALSDGRVDDLSLRFRNSALQFILLHELGHVLYGHNTDISLETAREQERQVDRFALEVMERTKTIPMGAIIYFQAQAYSLFHRGQFASDSDWETYLASQTHPLTTERLQAIALHLGSAAQREIRPMEKEFLTFTAGSLSKIVAILEDYVLGGCIAELAISADLATLKPRRGVVAVSELEKWCDF